MSGSGYFEWRVFFFDEEITDFCKSYSNSFDVAFALDFIEHLYDDDVIKIFSSIRDTLKADGKIIIHTPNGDFFLEIMKNKNISMTTDFTLWRLRLIIKLKITMSFVWLDLFPNLALGNLLGLTIKWYRTIYMIGH